MIDIDAQRPFCASPRPLALPQLPSLASAARYVARWFGVLFAGQSTRRGDGLVPLLDAQLGTKLWPLVSEREIYSVTVRHRS